MRYQIFGYDTVKDEEDDEWGDEKEEYATQEVQRRPKCVRQGVTGQHLGSVVVVDLVILCYAEYRAANSKSMPY